MDCVNCGSEARYHRAVFDLHEGELVGGFCRSCERRLGVTQRSVGTDPRSCEKCTRFGRFALPEHHIDVDIQDGHERVDEGYDIVDETPRYCDRHAPIVNVSPPSVDSTQKRLIDAVEATDD